MSTFHDDPGMQPARLSDRALDDLVAGRVVEGESGLVAAIAALAAAADVPAPAPSARLEALLAAGPVPVLPANRRSGPQRWGARAAVAVCGGLLALMGAATAQALPGPVQDAVEGAVRALTPFELPGAGARTDPGGPGARPDPAAPGPADAGGSSGAAGQDSGPAVGGELEDGATGRRAPGDDGGDEGGAAGGVASGRDDPEQPAKDTDGSAADGPAGDGPAGDGPAGDGPVTGGPRADGPDSDGPDDVADGPATGAPDEDAPDPAAPTAAVPVGDEVEGASAPSGDPSTSDSQAGGTDADRRPRVEGSDD